MLVTEHGILFNSPSDVNRAHAHPALDGVMHIFDAYWHGIRSATACLPGHKVAITHKKMADGDAVHHLLNYVAAHGIERICFQGLSENGVELAEIIKREFGSQTLLYVVTHVSSAQFENHFEMNMLKRIVDGQERGLFHRIGSVKPRFHGTVPAFWPKTLINLAPRVAALPALRSPDSVLIPVEPNWRKNLYTNALAAAYCEDVNAVYMVNWPNAMDTVTPLDKIRLIPFMKPEQLLARAASCAAIMHASLIECQPMTQLEGLAVGTPSLTAKIGAHPEIDRHPLTQLTEVEYPDDVGALTVALSRICRMWVSDGRDLLSMINDYLELRKRLSFESYQEFLN